MVYGLQFSVQIYPRQLTSGSVLLLSAPGSRVLRTYHVHETPPMSEQGSFDFSCQCSPA